MTSDTTERGLWRAAFELFGAGLVAASLAAWLGIGTAALGEAWRVDLLPRLPAALAVNGGLAVAALAARLLDRSGALAALAIGVAVYCGVGWRGYALLVAFFVIGSGLTLVGLDAKREAGLAQAASGRRSARHALANGGVAALAALAYAAASPALEQALGMAFAGALAAATADTASSEVGQLWGRPTLLVTSWKPVPAGTDGGVSAQGSLAGLVAVVPVALLGGWAGLYEGAGVVWVVASGFAGTVVDSLLGATLERRGLLDNEGVNLLATASGAVSAGLVALVAG